MITRCPSYVRINVARVSMASTVPVYWPDVISSPSRNGSRSRMRMPASRFWNVSWNANANATPPMPSPATMLENVSDGMTMVSATKTPKMRRTA